MKISREIKTAILVILGITFFVFGFNYLKGENLFESESTYYTEFDYNALTVSSPVTIKGNPIGKIKAINYDFNSGKTRVAFTVNEQLKFSKNSTIRLYEMGLMNGNAIAIIPSEDSDLAAPGDVLTSEIEPGLIKSLSKNFSGLTTGLDTTLKSADSLLVSLNKLVEDDTENGIKNALSEFNKTLKSFQSLAYSFNSLVSKNESSLNSVLTNFDKVIADLAVLSNGLKDVDISKTVSNLDTTLNNVNALMADLDKGKGSLGKLLKDEKLYHNLEVASDQLKDLLQDVKLNPKRYINVSVFGKKAKKYQEPDNERQ